jgi:glycosyltransferase involved in cell wall biosynthesis
LIATLHAAKRHHGCAFYSSAPHWTAHLIGLLAKRLTGRPWIADFRDPWRSNPFRKLPYPSVNRFDAWLETQVVLKADRVICNTEFVRQDFVARFPDCAKRFVTIPNGFDPEDYDGLNAHRPVGDGHLVITHAGYFYGPRRPQPVLQAIRLLRDQGRLRRRLCLQFIGPPTYEGRSLQSIVAELGVEDSVIISGEVPHRQALEALRGSDVQLLVGFGGMGSELQVPAKLFEYLGVGRPILALAPAKSAIAEVVKHRGASGEVCAPDNPQEIAEAIVRLDSRTRASLASDCEAERAVNSRFHRRAQVGRLAELLEDVALAHDF